MLNETRDKILIIEDDAERRGYIRKGLSFSDFWIQETNRFREFDPIWEEEKGKEIPSTHWLLNRHFFHVAIIDLSLRENDHSDQTGVEVLKAINRRQEGTKSLILTAHGTSEFVRDALRDLGANDFLDKIRFNEKLVERVTGVLKNAKLAFHVYLEKELNYYDLIQRPKLAEIANSLGSSSEQEIRTVIEGALRPYFPYDTKYITTSFKTLTIQDNQLSYFEILLWSRYLGNAISLCVGSRQVCEYRAMIAEHSHKKKGSDFVVFEESPRDSIVALVEYTPMKYPGDQPDSAFE